MIKATDQHEVDVFHGGGIYVEAECLRQGANDYRQHPYECSPHERSDQRAKPTNNCHEQKQERMVDVEAFNLGCTEPEKHHHCTSNTAIKR